MIITYNLKVFFWKNTFLILTFCIKNINYKFRYIENSLQNKKCSFERKKSFSQIKDLENSYTAVDEIETGHGNRIPLWLFGFLY
jgi:hypothetical protein